MGTDLNNFPLNWYKTFKNYRVYGFSSQFLRGQIHKGMFHMRINNNKCANLKKKFLCAISIPFCDIFHDIVIRYLVLKLYFFDCGRHEVFSYVEGGASLGYNTKDYTWTWTYQHRHPLIICHPLSSTPINNQQPSHSAPLLAKWLFNQGNRCTFLYNSLYSYGKLIFLEPNLYLIRIF